MKTTRTTEHRTDINFDDLDLVRSLLDKAKIKGVIKTIEFHYKVPGGGDWSGMEAPIDKDHSITAVILSRETVEE